MKELKNQINLIFDILKKIDINITNSASTSVDKIIDIINITATNATNATNTSINATNNLGINIELNSKINNTEAANIILEDAALTAKNIINNAD